MNGSVAEAQTVTPPLSLTGREWVLKDACERTVLALCQKTGLPDVLARILCLRGIEAEAVEGFLNPSLKNLLPDPSHLLDMDKAAARVAAAIRGRETIAVFGDYDVDGATSSALLSRYFRSLGLEPLVYIPDRMTEGYGPNEAALLSLKARGAKLVITVDCGTMAHGPLEAAHAAGLDVIVIDHHIGEARLPKAHALVNPNRLDEQSAHGNLAAVGVAFLLAVAVNRKLRDMGYFTTAPTPTLPLEGEGARSAGGGVSEPNLISLLDLVALGTVCDVVPLTGVNRALVAQGLKVMTARGNTGIRTLMDIARVTEKPGVYHAGFVIGPRINAGGRVGKSDLGVRLLSTDDPAEALALAQELDRHNAERKAIEAMVLEDAAAKAEALQGSQSLLVVAGKGWHAGVIGIVAGRLKERFHRPVAVVALENGVGKASARSVPGFDFGAAVIAARDSGLLLAGGGHAMAAGFSVEEDKIPALTEFLNARLAPVAGSTTAAQKRLTLDAMVHVAGATVELVSTLERLGPFGQGNPNIRVAVHNVINLRPEPVGDSHIKSWFKDPLGKGSLNGIAFRCRDTKLGEALMATRGRPVSIAGQLKINEWNQKQSVNLIIEDIALAG